MTDERNIGIQVGASVEAIESARNTVMDILNSSAEERTKVIALKVFSKLCKVENTVISGNNITVPKG